MDDIFLLKCIISELKGRLQIERLTSEIISLKAQVEARVAEKSRPPKD